MEEIRAELFMKNDLERYSVLIAILLLFVIQHPNFDVKDNLHDSPKQLVCLK